MLLSSGCDQQLREEDTRDNIDYEISYTATQLDIPSIRESTEESLSFLSTPSSTATLPDSSSRRESIEDSLSFLSASSAVTQVASNRSLVSASTKKDKVKKTEAGSITIHQSAIRRTNTKKRRRPSLDSTAATVFIAKTNRPKLFRNKSSSWTHIFSRSNKSSSARFLYNSKAGTNSGSRNNLNTHNYVENPNENSKEVIRRKRSASKTICPTLFRNKFSSRPHLLTNYNKSPSVPFDNTGNDTIAGADNKANIHNIAENQTKSSKPSINSRSASKTDCSNLVRHKSLSRSLSQNNKSSSGRSSDSTKNDNNIGSNSNPSVHNYADKLTLINLTEVVNT
mmetsp:Transcript_4251/g.4983  ORF Transcript_4251/g.4983 Transcript_4251/m.4983 type:complete len:339 (+) Transcript_4251:91-1107(+)